MVYQAGKFKAPASYRPASSPRGVLELQEHLRMLAARGGGIPMVTADGVYGPDTVRAVAAFQQAKGLSETGRADSETWLAIQQECARPGPCRTDAESPRPIYPFPKAEASLGPGDSGGAVYMVQILLADLSARYRNLAAPDITGVYDPKTTCAVGGFQDKCGVKITGRVDTRTWNRLAAVYGSLHE